MRLILLTIWMASVLPVALMGQFDIVSCEVYFDTDPGPGNGIAISSTSASNISDALDMLDASQLSQGVHRLCVRFKSSSGHWSSADCRYMYVQAQPNAPQPVYHQIVASEVYFDSDPGPGNAFAISTTSGTVADAVGLVDASLLPTGFHHACVRFKSTSGHWSDADCGFMYVQPQPNLSQPIYHEIVACEFFVDAADPGPGMATAIDLPGPAPEQQIEAYLDMMGTPEGIHTVSLRFKSSAGNWSHTEVRQFEVVDCSVLSDNVTLNEAVCFEYVIGGDTLTTAGSYVYTFTNQFGCDSIVNLNLTFLSAGCTNPEACNYDPLAQCDDGGCVLDTDPPIFTFVPEDLTISCDQTIPFFPATAADNCSGIQILTYSDVEIQGVCPADYIIERTFTAIDNDGNASQVTQMITVTDTEAPLFTFVPGDVFLECDDFYMPVLAAAEDICGNADLSFFDNVIPGVCQQSFVIERVFVAADPCGNSSTAIQYIYFEDTTAPVITADLEITIPESQAGQVFIDFQDNCSPTTVQLDMELISGGDDGVADYFYNYTAADECGNIAFFTQLVHVILAVPGCTDPTACNYDPQATEDDGSCLLPGCMDVAACNYDPAAVCESGLCTYPGCTNSAACNYDPAAGCDDGSCLVETGYLNVMVEASGQPVPDITVQIFDFTPASGQIAQLSGTAQTNANGMAWFAMFPEGDYVIRAVPDYQISEQQLFLTTYHSQTFQWTQAALVNVQCGDTTDAVVNMIQLPAPILGPGSASGFVTTHDFDRDGDPIPGIPIIIVRDTTTSAAPPDPYNYYFFSMDLTDEDGFYEFDNLPFGHYMTLITMPGLETYPHPTDMADTTAHQFYVVPSMPDQQQWTFLNYYVDEMLGIFLDTCLVGDTTCFPSVFEQAMLKSRWKLQPNPAADFTRLVRTDSPVRISEITLMESTGRVHRRWEPAGVIREQELDLRGLPSGLYFVVIRDEQGSEVLKLLKH